jgi:hypothetical protein
MSMRKTDDWVRIPITLETAQDLHGLKFKGEKSGHNSGSTQVERELSGHVEQLVTTEQRLGETGYFSIRAGQAKPG